MPNHCENDLDVTGDPAILRAFTEFARAPEGATDMEGPSLLSAHRFIPYPEEFANNRLVCPKCAHTSIVDAPGGLSFEACPKCGESMKDGYNRGGYEWCVAHWGTKWGLYDVVVTGGGPAEGEIGYTFLTAWAPPSPVILAMSERFPSLKFVLRYFEGGVGFQGEILFEEGMEQEIWQGDYHGDRGG